MEPVQKKLLKILKYDEVDAALTVGTAAVSVAKPLAGFFLTAAHEIAGLADEMRIDAVVRGLSTELNQEKQINQLYGYVGKSEENAFYVVNTLRKALLADSLIACTVMGRILAKHVNDGSSYDQNDNIVFHALENATDDDIRIFVKIMKEYRTEKGPFRIPDDKKDVNMQSAIEWCVYSRLFYGPSGGISWVMSEDEGYDTTHSPTSAGNRLMEYVESVKQILEYV